jgi:hypothetical protein
MKSQNDILIDFMLKGNSVDGMSALSLCGCWRLPSRINELRREYNIGDEWIVTKSGKRVKRYFMEVMR